MPAPAASAELQQQQPVLGARIHYHVLVDPAAANDESNVPLEQLQHQHDQLNQDLSASNADLLEKIRM